MKKNIGFALGVLAVAALFFLMRPGSTGAEARVDIAGGGTVCLPLSQDGVYPIEGAALPVTLEVKDGAVRFVVSVCPDHICENTGGLRLEGDVYKRQGQIGLAVLALHADVQAACLCIAQIGAGADLEVLLLAGARCV